MFFYFDLEKKSNSPEGAVFCRTDVPGSGLTAGILAVYRDFFCMYIQLRSHETAAGPVYEAK